MASRVELFDVSTPANTAIATPQVTPINFDIGDVERIEVRIPSGPSGLVGFGIMHGGASVFPREESKWIIANDERLDWPTDHIPTAGDWAIRSYNLDVYAHTVYFRFLVTEVGQTLPARAPIPVIEQPDQIAPEPEDELPEAV